jgi:hypothetical protein
MLGAHCELGIFSLLPSLHEHATYNCPTFISAFISAPLRASNLIISPYPFAAALCTTVQPFKSFISVFAPFSSNTLQHLYVHDLLPSVVRLTLMHRVHQC